MTPANLGIVEWFPLGDHEHVERSLEALAELQIEWLRTGVSWADCYTPEGNDWYAWLLPTLSRQVEVLPCFTYTPPSEGIAPRTSSPPRRPGAYADWMDAFVTDHGRHFDYVELWNEANNVSEWDWTLDHDWHRFSEMIGAAAFWMKHRGKRTVLGGMSPIDPNWIDLMINRGVIEHIDVVGVHGFPGAWTAHWEGWDSEISKIRDVLDRHESPAQIWITETGHSTWRNDARGQADALREALAAPVERIFWYGLYDLRPELSAIDGFHVDERDYHFGLKKAGGEPKTLFRLWHDIGLQEAKDLLSVETPHVSGSDPVTLITGGAGFVGTNVARRELEAGRRVVLFDNLTRPGVEHNVRGLKRDHRDRVELIVGDIRDSFSVRKALDGVSRVYHFAAQVAVTTSLTDPITDFEINTRGTLNLLEALRALASPPPILFTSTNKVYGDLDDLSWRRTGQRYEPCNPDLLANGISEQRPLDFHSPYGCSKGAADQYVLDYARSYSLPAVVFRMSCIYGRHQFGNEDQGWVAHFLIRALQGLPITLYGDGRQVRDILFADDLASAMQKAHEKIALTSGSAFNIGGGPSNTVSLLELLDQIRGLVGHDVETSFEGWRNGDQRYYVSDHRKFSDLTGWQPQVGVREGVARLARWLSTDSPLIEGGSRMVGKVSVV